MDALVMCGGEGTRLGADVEKPLLEINTRPMVDHVCEALAASHVDRTYAVASPATPETAARVDCPVIETPGEGYVADLQRALSDDRISRPVLTVAADLPLLDRSAINRILDASTGSLTVAIPVGRKRALGVSVDTAYRDGGRLLTPAGINVVGGAADDTLVARDRRLAVNVNRPRDARRAAWFRQ